MSVRNHIKKFAFASAVTAILASSAGLATAATPSAKFAAVWSTSPSLASVAVITNATADTAVVNSKTGHTLATIKVPQGKELLVGVSAEIGLVTDGTVKGSGGGGGSSLADAKAYVTVVAVPRAGGDPIEAKPGTIMLNRRVQKLEAELGGVLQSCADSDANGTIDVATECVLTDEKVGLLQDTTSAHHFNLVFPNMNQGVYDIKAYFTTGARAEVDICEACGGTAQISAYAKAVINKTMMSVQTVRAAQNGLTEIEIIPAD